jgi:DNA mismatch endonuclease (patch repair protein)
MPKSRPEFWGPKLEGNKRRDAENMERLAREEWKVLTIWECQLNDAESLQDKIRRFLDAER